jgi:plastocyanin
MSNELLFYICGVGLAASAVLVCFIGLKVKSFPGKAFPLLILWFAILAGGATTFAVLHAKDEEHEKSAELEQAGKEIDNAGTTAPFDQEGALNGPEEEAEEEVEKGKQEPHEPVGPEESEGATGQSQGSSQGKGATGASETLKLAADETDIAYDTDSLSGKAGKVTIDFTNPSALEHDVAIEDEGGEEVADSELIAKSSTSVSAELAPGTYTFFCTVPGHREAGMEGTLTVK